jgi:hypothetical protein
MHFLAAVVGVASSLNPPSTKLNSLSTHRCVIVEYAESSNFCAFSSIGRKLPEEEESSKPQQPEEEQISTLPEAVAVLRLLPPYTFI